MINLSNPKIGLWKSSKSLRKSSNRLKFWWLKVIYCIWQSNKLEREIKHKTGAAKQGASWPTQIPP